MTLAGGAASHSGNRPIGQARDFIDTTGLGCLLELRSTLQGRDVLFEIAAADGPVRRAVDVTGLGHLLTA
jgi:anti-anti-sigma regulatory factor